MLDLSRLSPEQRQVVTAPDGPLVVIAGPGSGKTTVLAARIAYLVAVRGVSPPGILALTFATKAARELRERLTRVLGAEGRQVVVSTFHALGLSIVRGWAAELGFGPGPPAVLGPGEASLLLREAALRSGWEEGRLSFADVAPRLRAYRLRGGSTSGTVEDVRLRSLSLAYETLLRERGAIDFPAMLSLPLALFTRRPDILGVYQATYRFVLCDEFHDVCPAQYAFLQFLSAAHRNLIVVADPCQAIYGWRGADAGLLGQVGRDFPETRTLHLRQNFRSSGRIVALANALGAGLADHRPLWTRNWPGQPVLVHAAADGEAEAAFVAREAVRLLEAGAIAHPGEAAVLYRANWQSEALVAALRERGLPYRLHGRTHPGQASGESRPPDPATEPSGETADGRSRVDGEDANGSATGRRAVFLSTVHAAKGGEWPVVFLVGLEEGLLPHALVERSPSEEGLAEERRVAYVGMTRPRERLYLSRALSRRHAGRAQPRLPSRFLRGLPFEPYRPAA